MPARDAVIVLVKAPRPGTVKTRLAAGLGAGGAERAAALYRALAEHAVREALALAPDGVDVAVHFDPPDARGEVAAWLGPEFGSDLADLANLALVPQRGGDLGARIRDAMSDAFARGAARAVVIGSDCPALSSAHLCAALGALGVLAGADLVLGPARDGGYWLVGARGGVPPVFEGIPWSTPSVLARTLDLASAARLRVVLLETLSDVDTAADLPASPS